MGSPATNFYAEIENICQAASKRSTITTLTNDVFLIVSCVAIQTLGSLRKSDIATATEKPWGVLLTDPFPGNLFRYVANANFSLSIPMAIYKVISTALLFLLLPSALCIQREPYGFQSPFAMFNSS
ncbi:hypothetical protein CEXT_144731 [Caerostris extrusa]|uniref:Uncharacterized protein n=1 Tax=Caerostris extrusa TaxID=172846 RepID=A0AAV4RHS0_CAEEX|nr:hypothetical protein CEXT_144731 [Caerostris extrusa]